MKPLRAAPLLLALLFAASCRNLEAPAIEKPTKLSTSGEDNSDDKPKSTEIVMGALSQRVPVIMYHDFVEAGKRKGVYFDCTEDEFREEMQKIKDRGYHPVSVDDLYDHLTSGKQLPSKAIVLTADDNYQGFYNVAWPILKQFGYPCAMFVHTRYVGKTTGRAHMSWDTLKLLLKDPLFTVGSHTVSHPDLTTLDSIALDTELAESKSALEEHLGIKVKYFAYPDGKNDDNTQIAVRNAGYAMAFTMVNGPAEESPNIECVNRYIESRLDTAMDDAENDANGTVGIYDAPIKEAPVAYKEENVDGKVLAMVTGGHPVSVTSDTREGVLDFIHRTSGAVAGINGTFFDMAAISSTDNKLVGPCKTADGSTVMPDSDQTRWPKIRNRPVIMWGPDKAAIVPYDPPLMNEDAAYKEFMPDVTNVFLAGAWLVHSGVAATSDQLKVFASKDVEDPRRRASFGFLADGTPVAAASKDSVSSSEFASMLAKAGVQEAILLDSGFSTSLVYNEKIMASGHSTSTMPSRPVPHAILFLGNLDPNSAPVAAAAVPATDLVAETSTSTGHPRRRRRRRSRRRRQTDSVTVTTAPPPDAAPSGPPPTSPP